MKKLLLSALAFLFSVQTLCALTPSRAVDKDAIPSDGVLRFYRLAVPITLSSYEEDLDSDYNNVLAFWQECENFANQVFIPLGYCFDVVVDERLVMSSPNSIDSDIYSAPAYGTELLDSAIGSDSYDVGMWVTHRDLYAENTGLSVLNGAYSASTKASGYAKTDKWVVAHELGHMFGAVHTPSGEGSLMGANGAFFSYPSIKAIRSQSIQRNEAYYSDAARTSLVGSNFGGNYVYGVKVSNSAPQFSAAMPDVIRIPQGSCLSIALQVTDAESHRLMSAAIGCNSASVDQVIEGADLPHFASLAPIESLSINYSPAYAVDPFDDTYFYPVDGTDIPSMSPGTYAISLLVNDMPASESCNYESLIQSPFYSQFAVCDASVQIIQGTAFTASISPAKTDYSAGEKVTIEWGVNPNYFTADSRLRITLSADYGKTFPHVLAESVPALTGQCTVSMPNVNVKSVDVDFITAVKQMPGGIIRVEEIGGAAYTLTSLSPTDGNAFTISGATDDGTSGINSVELASVAKYFDLSGRPVPNPTRGIYIRYTPSAPPCLVSLPN